MKKSLQNIINYQNELFKNQPYLQKKVEPFAENLKFDHLNTPEKAKEVNQSTKKEIQSIKSMKKLNFRLLEKERRKHSPPPRNSIKPIIDLFENRSKNKKQAHDFINPKIRLVRKNSPNNKENPSKKEIKRKIFLSPQANDLGKNITIPVRNSKLFSKCNETMENVYTVLKNDKKKQGKIETLLEEEKENSKEEFENELIDNDESVEYSLKKNNVLTKNLNNSKNMLSSEKMINHQLNKETRGIQQVLATSISPLENKTKKGKMGNLLVLPNEDFNNQEPSNENYFDLKEQVNENNDLVNDNSDNQIETKTLENKIIKQNQGLIKSKHSEKNSFELKNKLVENNFLELKNDSSLNTKRKKEKNMRNIVPKTNEVLFQSERPKENYFHAKEKQSEMFKKFKMNENKFEDLEEVKKYKSLILSKSDESEIPFFLLRNDENSIENIGGKMYNSDLDIEKRVNKSGKTLKDYEKLQNFIWSKMKTPKIETNNILKSDENLLSPKIKDTKSRDERKNENPVFIKQIGDNQNNCLNLIKDDSSNNICSENKTQNFSNTLKMQKSNIPKADNLICKKNSGKNKCDANPISIKKKTKKLSFSQSNSKIETNLKGELIKSKSLEFISKNDPCSQRYHEDFQNFVLPKSCSKRQYNQEKPISNTSQSNKKKTLSENSSRNSLTIDSNNNEICLNNIKTIDHSQPIEIQNLSQENKKQLQCKKNKPTEILNISKKTPIQTKNKKNEFMGKQTEKLKKNERKTKNDTKNFLKEEKNSPNSQILNGEENQEINKIGKYNKVQKNKNVKSDDKIIPNNLPKNEQNETTNAEDIKKALPHEKPLVFDNANNLSLHSKKNDEKNKLSYNYKAKSSLSNSKNFEQKNKQCDEIHSHNVISKRLNNKCNKKLPEAQKKQILQTLENQKIKNLLLEGKFKPILSKKETENLNDILKSPIIKQNANKKKSINEKNNKTAFFEADKQCEINKNNDCVEENRNILKRAFSIEAIKNEEKEDKKNILHLIANSIDEKKLWREGYFKKDFSGDPFRVYNMLKSSNIMICKSLRLMRSCDVKIFFKI